MPGPLVFIDRCHSGQLRKTWSSATPQVTESTKRILLDERGARIFGILASLHPCILALLDLHKKVARCTRCTRCTDVALRFKRGFEVVQNVEGNKASWACCMRSWRPSLKSCLASPGVGQADWCDVAARDLGFGWIQGWGGKKMRKLMVDSRSMRLFPSSKSSSTSL